MVEPLTGRQYSALRRIVEAKAYFWDAETAAEELFGEDVEIDAEDDQDLGEFLATNEACDATEAVLLEIFSKYLPGYEAPPGERVRQIETWGAAECLDYIRHHGVHYAEPEETADVDLDEVRALVRAHRDRQLKGTHGQSEN